MLAPGRSAHLELGCWALIGALGVRGGTRPYEVATRTGNQSVMSPGGSELRFSPPQSRGALLLLASHGTAPQAIAVIADESEDARR